MPSAVAAAGMGAAAATIAKQEGECTHTRVQSHSRGQERSTHAHSRGHGRSKHVPITRQGMQHARAQQRTRPANHHKVWWSVRPAMPTVERI